MTVNSKWKTHKTFVPITFKNSTSAQHAKKLHINLFYLCFRISEYSCSWIRDLWPDSTHVLQVPPHKFLYLKGRYKPQITYIGRDETGLVYVMRGGGRAPPPSPARTDLPSSLNVRQKAAVATLCTLWYKLLFQGLFLKPNSLTYNFIEFLGIILRVLRHELSGKIR